MGTIVLVEFHWFGHHPAFFKLYVRTLLELDCKVLALCPNPDELAAWVEDTVPNKRECLRAVPFFDISVLPVSERRIRSLVASLLSLYRATRIIRNPQANPFGPPDLVFYACIYSARWIFPFLADWLMPYPWACLFMGPAESIARQPRREWMRRLLLFDRFTLLRAHNCCAVLSFIETANAELSRILDGKPVLTAPDTADFTLRKAQAYPLLREIQERACGRKIIGQFGIMGPAKGLTTLLRAAMKLDRTRCFFVAVGALSRDPHEAAAYRAELEAEPAIQQENVVVRFEHIPDESCYNALVAQCDVLFMAYLRFSQSSNNMVKAAHFRKPMIVSKGYVMGERVHRFRLGAVISEGNVDECCAAIEQLTARDWEGRTNPLFGEFGEMHSVDALPSVFRNLMDVAEKARMEER